MPNQRKPVPIGYRTERLEVLRELPSEKYGYCYEVRCDCGNITTISPSSIRKGQRSCGCLKREQSRELMAKMQIDGVLKRPDGHGLQWRGDWHRRMTRRFRPILLNLQDDKCAWPLCTGGPLSEYDRIEVDHDNSCCPSGPGAKSKGCPKCVRGVVHKYCNYSIGVIERYKTRGAIAILDERVNFYLDNHRPIIRLIKEGVYLDFGK